MSLADVFTACGRELLKVEAEEARRVLRALQCLFEGSGSGVGLPRELPRELPPKQLPAKVSNRKTKPTVYSVASGEYETVQKLWKKTNEIIPGVPVSGVRYACFALERDGRFEMATSGVARFRVRARS